MNDDLLIKYIIGTATDEEQSNIQTWLEDDPKHQAHYQQLLQLWQFKRVKNNNTSIDVEAAWQRFVDKRATLQQPAQTKRITLFNWRRAMVAASLLFCAVITYFFTALQPYEHRTQNDVASLTLPDQSTIVLNKDSHIKYKKNFNKKNRVIELEGEAFFDVAKNPEMPFIVQVDNIEVLVLGTSFNIRSNESVTEVVVESGLVRVRNLDTYYKLHPGDKLEINHLTNAVSLGKVNHILYQYYRTNLFVCDHTPLIDVVKELSVAYNVTIEVNNDLLKQEPLTNKFSKDESIETILQIIAQTLNADVQKNGSVYSIH